MSNDSPEPPPDDLAEIPVVRILVSIAMGVLASGLMSLMLRPEEQREDWVEFGLSTLRVFAAVTVAIVVNIVWILVAMTLRRWRGP
jgi:hypothetical protein